MRIGYARVSTTEQNLDLQRDAFRSGRILKRGSVRQRSWVASDRGQRAQRAAQCDAGAVGSGCRGGYNLNLRFIYLRQKRSRKSDAMGRA